MAMTDSSVVVDAIRTIAPCTEGESPVERSAAERFMRRLLFIRERDNAVTDDDAHSIFSKSILLSATRCTLAYVVFPIFAPALYAASNWGPAIGLTVGILALIFDVASIRRFWAADHKYRWLMTGIYACVIGLVTSLLITDVGRIVSHFS